MKEFKLNNSGVIFDEDLHSYHLGGRELQGITKTLIPLAYPKTYSDVPKPVLNHAAERGKACHQAVQNLIVASISSTGYEAVAECASSMLANEHLTPIAWEYIVTDFNTYASPIDILCVNNDDELCIVDMKFTSQLHSPEVTLQTSIYRRFFHLVNPDLPQVAHLYVLHIRTNDYLQVLEHGLYELHPVGDNVLDALFTAAESNTPFDITAFYGRVPQVACGAEEEVCRLTREIKERQERLDHLRADILSAMTSAGVKSYSTARCSFTTTLAKPRASFQTSLFKKEHADLYNSYVKLTPTKPSLRITINGEG